MSSFFSSNQRSTDSTISESDRSLAPSSNKFEFHQGAMTKFYGRAVVISRNDKTYNDTLAKLKEINKMRIQFTGGSKDSQEFFNDLSEFIDFLDKPSSTIPLYQLDILSDVFVNYVAKLQSRFFNDSKRIHQLKYILNTVAQTKSDPHPAACLSALGKVVEAIKKEPTLFKSELMTTLDNQLARQWQPIIADNRQLLQSLGVKLLGVGFMGVVGWPLVVMYPLFSHATKLLDVLKEWERMHKLSPQSIFEIVKVVVMMLVCFQLMSILQLYMSLGYMAVLVGGASVVMSQNDAMIKQYSPVISPHASAIDKFLLLLDSGDLTKVGTLIQGAATNLTNEHQNPLTAFPTSHRVEEIPDTDYNQNGDEDEGVRRRKKNK